MEIQAVFLLTVLLKLLLGGLEKIEISVLDFQNYDQMSDLKLFMLASLRECIVYYLLLENENSSYLM